MELETSPSAGRANFGMLVWLAVVVLAGILVGLLIYCTTSRQHPQGFGTRHTSASDEERFVAVFDSLYQVRLRPLTWKSAVFTRAEFDDKREEWTLTIASGDWQRRSLDSKKDLVARLHTALQATRAQAGGDPDIASVNIEDEAGERLAISTNKSGTVVYR
jgi:hypothetical protein